MFGFLRRWYRGRTLEKVSVDESQWLAAEAALPFLARLGPDDRQRLRQMAREFIAEKEWNGARDLQLRPDMQLVIALQACLPVLNLGLDWYDGWVGIVVYPGDFVIPRQIMDETGVLHEYEEDALGEAWEGGPVLVAWFDDPAEAEGVNTVIHELAHKLDMTNGAVDGLPRLHSGMSKSAWLAAFEPAFHDFCRQVDEADRRGRETALDPYGSENPAEFFAVMSEAFFQTPRLLRRHYPGVYDQLQQFYRQQPAPSGVECRPCSTGI